MNFSLSNYSLKYKYCVRFLKARKFDLDKTVQMWVDMLKWRKDNGVDSIIQVNMYYWFSASPLLSQETG